MARQFKPVRFFVMMAAAAFVVCGVTVFYTHRAAHGRTAEERAAYAIGEKAGEEAPAGAKLPRDADLNMMAQKYFKQQGPANSRVGTWPSRTVTRMGSRRRITGSDPLNETLLATD
jgi:hypothetical protein